ncbi:MAG TPA: hypothetical protein VIM14_18610 [Polyangia bacterium]
MAGCIAPECGADDGAAARVGVEVPAGWAGDAGLGVPASARGLAEPSGFAPDDGAMGRVVCRLRSGLAPAAVPSRLRAGNWGSTGAGKMIS